ncbi:MAG: precorrin-6y C5,15-methyltransferase (decarboxylating) subunit CbiE [Pirellulales bacterium]
MAKATENRIYIIGMGDDGWDGLTNAARKIVSQAELLVGDDSTIGRVPELAAERLIVGGDLDALVERLRKEQHRQVVVLASGDPLFYGVARFLCDALGKDRFEVLPHVSSMQMAFARVKESWEDAYLTSLATHSLADVVERVRIAERVGLFTTEENTPGRVAAALLERGITYYSAYVCENLGSPDECVTQGELADLVEMQFSPLNVMILIRDPNAPDRPSNAVGRRLFGNPDDSFLQSTPKTGLLTPAEVRCLALSEMDLGATSVVWDIGAGSGSVAVEAAGLATAGTVYALEMDSEDYELIKQNAAKFAAGNLRPVLGRAPEAFADFADPDAVFVGGTGRDAANIVEQAYRRLKPGGRLVTNAASIDSVSDVHRTLNELNGNVKVLMINLARGTFQLERVRFDALNPSFLLSVVKRREA